MTRLRRIACGPRPGPGLGRGLALVPALVPVAVALFPVALADTPAPPRTPAKEAPRARSTAALRLVEPFGLGGGVDVICRDLVPKLAAVTSRPVTVDNRQGDGGTAAPAFVARAEPDGSTLLVSSSAQVFTAALRTDLSYDPKAFVPIASLTSQPYVFVASRLAKIRSLQDLSAAAEAAPGKLRFASTGAGTASHLGAVKLNLAAGIRAAHRPALPGEGIAAVIEGVISGRADYMLAPIPFALAGIHDGGLVPLGVSGARRSPLLPEVPTIEEAGLAGFDFTIWYGVWAPAGTPAGVADALAADFGRVLDDADTRAALALRGAEPLRLSREDFARLVDREIAAAARLIDAAGWTPR